MIMDHAFKLAYTIKTTISCVVHRSNANPDTRIHMGTIKMQMQVQVPVKEMEKKYSCTSITLLFTHVNLGNANTNANVR